MNHYINDVKEVMFMIAALPESLKNWHYYSKYARHLLADRLNDGDEDYDESSIRDMLDDIQETVINGACICAIPEDVIAAAKLKFIVPVSNNDRQALEICDLFKSVCQKIDTFIHRCDSADNDLWAGIAHRFKYAAGMIYRDVILNNEGEDGLYS